MARVQQRRPALTGLLRLAPGASARGQRTVAALASHLRARLETLLMVAVVAVAAVAVAVAVAGAPVGF